MDIEVVKKKPKQVYVTPKPKPIKELMSALDWDTFEEMCLRLHNQLDCRVKEGSTTQKFLIKMDKLKDKFEGKEIKQMELSGK